MYITVNGIQHKTNPTMISAIRLVALCSFLSALIELGLMTFERKLKFCGFFFDFVCDRFQLLEFSVQVANLLPIVVCLGVVLTELLLHDRQRVFFVGFEYVDTQG